MRSREDVLITGAGTLGTIVFDCLLDDERWRPVAFIDDVRHGTELHGLPIVHSGDCRRWRGTPAIAAIASPIGRRRFVQHLSALSLDWITFVDRRSHVSTLADVGIGTVVLPFATIGPDTRVGAFGYIGAYAAVGAGADLGPFASLMARASAGACTTAACCQIGFNSACLDGASLGEEVVVTPYTWVRKAVPAHTVVAGHSAGARMVKRRSQAPIERSA